MKSGWSYRNRAHGCGAIQRDLGRLEVWVNRNLTMFKGEWDVLNMEKDNLRQKYGLGDDQQAGKQLCRKRP